MCLRKCSCSRVAGVHRSAPVLQLTSCPRSRLYSVRFLFEPKQHGAPSSNRCAWPLMSLCARCVSLARGTLTVRFVPQRVSSCWHAQHVRVQRTMIPRKRSSAPSLASILEPRAPPIPMCLNWCKCSTSHSASFDHRHARAGTLASVCTRTGAWRSSRMIKAIESRLRMWPSPTLTVSLAKQQKIRPLPTLTGQFTMSSDWSAASPHSPLLNFA